MAPTKAPREGEESTVCLGSREWAAWREGGLVLGLERKWEGLRTCLICLFIYSFIHPSTHPHIHLLTIYPSILLSTDWANLVLGSGATQKIVVFPDSPRVPRPECEGEHLAALVEGRPSFPLAFGPVFPRVSVGTNCEVIPLGKVQGIRTDKQKVYKGHWDPWDFVVQGP